MSPQQGTEAEAGPADAAAGFKYTPSSYLLRRREENKPWAVSSGSSVSSDRSGRSARSGRSSASRRRRKEEDLEEFAMRQEDRPERMGTSIDSHFQNRVRRKKLEYKRIISGEVDLGPDGPEGAFVGISRVDEHFDAQDSEMERKRRIEGAGNARAKANHESAAAEAARTVQEIRGARLRELRLRSEEEADAAEAMRIRRERQAEIDRMAAERDAMKAKLEAMRTSTERARVAELERARHELERERRAFERAKAKTEEEMRRRAEMEAFMRKGIVEGEEKDEEAKEREQSGDHDEKSYSDGCNGDAERCIDICWGVTDISELCREAGVCTAFASLCFGEDEARLKCGEPFACAPKDYRRASPDNLSCAPTEIDMDPAMQ